MIKITKIPAPAYKEREETEDGLDKNEAATAAVAIGVAFPWKDTAEGYDFWAKVSNRLRAIANGEPLE